MGRFGLWNENVQSQYLSRGRRWPPCSPGKCCALSPHPFPARKPDFQQKAQVRWFYFSPPIKSSSKQRRALSTKRETRGRGILLVLGSQCSGHTRRRAGLTGRLKRHGQHKTFSWRPSSFSKAIKSNAHLCLSLEPLSLTLFP